MPHTFEFELTFSLPGLDDDPEWYADKLEEGGCEAAGAGTGRRGLIGLMFERSARSAHDAVEAAIADVMKVIPGARLREVGPDLVGLTDIADLAGCTRQNMAKHATKPGFPAAVYSGGHALWRLAEVARWLGQNTPLSVGDEAAEVARVAALKNLELQRARVAELQAA